MRTRFRFLGLLLLAVMGCATTERQRLLERSVSHVAYRIPPEQVLGVARKLLMEQGYSLLESTDPLSVRTDWRVNIDQRLDVGTHGERCVIVGKQLDDGRLVLEAYRMSFTTVGQNAARAASVKTDVTTVQRVAKGDPLSYTPPVIVRDLELEWRILSRVAPAAAHALESQTDEYLATQSK